MRNNFCSWLLRQKDMQDPIGDLARDVQEDINNRKSNPNYPQFANGANVRYKFPRYSSDFRDWWNYLKGTDAEDAIVRAFKEWINDWVQESEE